MSPFFIYKTKLTISSAKFINKKRKKDFNDDLFPFGILEIWVYEVFVLDNNSIQRKYLIELHHYDGFAMIKFYPHHLKKSSKKYESRGKTEIGFQLSNSHLLNLIFECAILMRDFLITYPDSFIGYVGQVDAKDNKNKREVSQRCSVYNILTSSIFSNQHYKFSSKSQFKEINLRLIRRIRSKQEGKLNAVQFKNYSKFLKLIEENPSFLYQLMTETTKTNICGNITS